MTVTVEVKCISCKHKWQQGPLLGGDMVPTCPKCGSVGVATRAVRDER